MFKKPPFRIRHGLPCFFFCRKATLGIILLCLPFLPLSGCGNDEGEKAAPVASEKESEKKQVETGCGAKEEALKEQAAVILSATPAKQKPDLPALTESERDRADKILAFSNNAQNVFRRAYFSLPEKLRKNTRRYMETFHLGESPKLAGRKWALDQLAAPKGVFNDEEAQKLTQGLREMDNALMAMLGHYRELEKYVADTGIRDDGKQGEELSKKIDDGWGQFMKARSGWLDIVENNAANAEKLLLREHPLERQILAARKIFLQFDEIALILKEGKPNREMLANLERNLAGIISYAAKPPFDASPALERRYRAFLASARNYVDKLNAGLDEGFFSVQRRELNQAAQNCGKAYNDFVRMANQGERR